MPILDAACPDAPNPDSESAAILPRNVLHEFNNLLAIINGCSEVLLAGMSESDPQHVFVDQIKQAGERACDLTRQLLCLSRRAGGA